MFIAHINSSGQIEQLNTGVNYALAGVMTVLIAAPDEEQKLFALTPKDDLPSLATKFWVQDCAKQLEPHVSNLIEQNLLRASLSPVSRSVSFSCLMDNNKKLMFAFSVQVQTHPGVMPIQQSQVPSSAN